MSRVLSLAWWSSIAWALVRTGLAALVPFIPALVADPAGTWRVAVLTLALVLVLAIASALASLPDIRTGSWWEVAIQRSLRQFGQMVGAAAASAAILTDVNWRVVLIAAAGSALSTLVIAAITSLPGPLELAPTTPDAAAVVTTVTRPEAGHWSNGDPVHLILDGTGSARVAPNLNGATWVSDAARHLA